MALFTTWIIARQDVKFARAQILSFGFTITLVFECASQLSYIRYVDKMEKQGKEWVYVSRWRMLTGGIKKNGHGI